MVDEGTVRLAELMQNAALDPTQWEPALNAVNAFVGGSGVVLLTVKARQRFAPTSTNIAELMDDYFQQGWYRNDRREACIPLLKANGIVFDHEFASIEDIENCDYYQDLLARHGCKWFAGVGVEIDGDDWCLALQRSPTAGPFGGPDMTRLRLVRRVLANTASLSARVGRYWIAGLQHALHVNAQPAVLFDSQARVLDLNEAGASIVKSFIGKDRLIRFGHAKATTALNELLAAALRLLERHTHSESVRDIQLGGKAYRCRAINLLGHEGLIATSAAILMLMEPIADGPERVIRARYGLTEAEVRVSMALADGKSVEEIAADGAVKANTIRAHLKSIYSKTSIKRQSQLVALVRTLDEARS